MPQFESGRCRRKTWKLSPDERAEARPEELRLLEAMLFAAAAPLDEKTLAAKLPRGRRRAPGARDGCRTNTRRAASIWSAGRGKWTFRTAGDLCLASHARRRSKPRKLSRAAIETLAIIAYHQPVTRAEIEDIRGVTTSKGTVDVLLETGWIRPRGRRKAPGRPITYGPRPRLSVAFRARRSRRPARP